MSPSKFLDRNLYFYALFDHLGALVPHYPIQTIRSTYDNTNNIILLPQNRPYVRSSMPTSRWRYDEMQTICIDTPNYFTL